MLLVEQSWALSGYYVATIPTKQWIAGSDAGKSGGPIEPGSGGRIMPPHSRAMLERMLPEAEGLVARGAERIQAQEARVVALEHKGTATDQSKKLLAVMKQTQELQIEHVMLLRRELAVSS